ncbi:MAG TPA: protein kinase [Solirubrobacteraceae bacterium]
MADLTPGSVFAGLRIEGVAGRGGMGVVYRATDPALGRSVALKVIASELLGDAAMRARFVRESRAAAAIEHPNVVPIYSAGEEGGVAYIVMRLVPGEDLRERVRRDGGLEPAVAARLVAQVGDALDGAHEAGLVHRDVKPANILIGAGDHAYLSDFGLARHAVSDAGLTRTGGWVGTLDYVAPEQIQGTVVDARADVYALGCVLFYALTGRVPYPRDADEARLWAHVHADPPRPSAEGVPAAFDGVIRTALAKDPEDRFQSAGDLGRAAVAAAEAGEGAPATAGAGRPGRRGGPARRPAVEGWLEAGRSARGRTPDGRLGAGRSARGRAVEGRRRSLLVGSLVGGGLLLVALLIVLVLGLVSGGDGGSGRIDSRVVRPLDRVTHVIPVGDQPNTIRIAGGNAWVTSAEDRRLGRVGAAAASERRGPVVGEGARDIAVVGDVLWVTLGEQHQVARLRSTDGKPVADPIATADTPKQIDARAGAVWVGLTADDGGPDDLVEYDARSGEELGRLEVPAGITDIRATDDAIWIVARRRPYLLRVDPEERRIVLRRELAPKPLRVDVAAGYVWVTNHGDNTVARVDPESGEAVPIAVPSKPYGIDATEDGIWVSCYGDHSVVKIDPRTSRVDGQPIPVGLNPTGVAVDARYVWVASRAEDSVTRFERR